MNEPATLRRREPAHPVNDKAESVNDEAEKANDNVKTFPTAEPRPTNFTFEAPCSFCGQMHYVYTQEEKPSKEQLTEASTKVCYCDEAVRMRVVERAKVEIPKWFGEKCSAFYGSPVDAKTEAWLLEGALLLATSKIDAIAVTLREGETAKMKGSGEKVKIARARKKQWNGTI